MLIDLWLRDGTGTGVWFPVVLLALVVAALWLRSPKRVRFVRERESLAQVAQLPPIPAQILEVDRFRAWLRLLAFAAAVLLLAAPVFTGAGLLAMIGQGLIFFLVGLSLLVIVGWAGHVSFGQFAFVGAAAWAVMALNLPIYVGLPVGLLVGGVAAVAVGAPAMRTGGLSYAVVTLVLALVVSGTLLSRGGAGTLMGSGPAAAGLFGLDLRDPVVFHYVALAVVAATVAAVVGLRRSRFGRAILAVRLNEPAASSFGFNPDALRWRALALSGAIAGLAGALSAYSLGGDSPARYSVDHSLQALMFTAVGGFGSISGSALGATVWTALNHGLSANPLILFLSSGLGAILVLVAVPGGLAALGAAWRDAFLVREAYRLGVPIPRLMGDGGLAAMMGKAPLDEKRRTVRLPGEPPLRRYRLKDQWALDRHAAEDSQAKERVGD